MENLINFDIFDFDIKILLTNIIIKKNNILHIYIYIYIISS